MFVLPGQYYDQETGLHYNRWRTYDPATGRYLEADPIGITKDFSDPALQVAMFGFNGSNANYDFNLNHPYVYASNNPITNIDLYGLASTPTIPGAPPGAPSPDTCLEKGEDCAKRAQRGIIECALKRGMGQAGTTCKEEWHTWAEGCFDNPAPPCKKGDTACKKSDSNDG